MSFIVLLLLSLVSVVRVEIKTAAINRTRVQAEQNALLALNLGLQELQKAMGPDRRVSAIAEILEVDQPHINRAAVDVKQSKWVGVWNAEGGLRNWLVSGNEGSEAPTEVVDDAVLNYYPEDAVTGVAANQSASDTVTIAGAPGVVLVASGAVGDLDATSIVIAPRVEIDQENSYAWWVSDEGVKARADLVDRYEEDGQLSASARSASAQRNAVELIDGFTSFAPSVANGDEVDKLFDYPDVRFLGVGEDDQQAHFHDLTLYSSGVLTDTRLGGLKRDLTYLFELSESDFQNEIDDLYADAGFTPSQDPEGATPIAQLDGIAPDWFFDANPNLDSADFEVWQVGAPSWEQLRSFYRIKDEINGAGAPVRAQTANTHGIYPTLLQARMFAGISRRLVDNGGDATPETADDEMDIFLHTRVMAVLGNPYSVDLDIDEMYVSFFTHSSGFGAGEPGQTPDDSGPFLEYFGDDYVVYRKLKFRIANQTIPAGKAVAFTLNAADADILVDPDYPCLSHIDDGTYDLIKGFDPTVSLRKVLPGGPYRRDDSDGTYLWMNSNTNLSVATWGPNPADHTDILQFSNGVDGSMQGLGKYVHSPYIGQSSPNELDGDILWGGVPLFSKGCL
jgi:hypothetical protein